MLPNFPPLRLFSCPIPQPSLGETLVCMFDHQFPQLLERLEVPFDLSTVVAPTVLTRLTQTRDTQLTSLILHELRNPLSVIQSSIEILQVPSVAADPQRSQKHLERIQTKIRQINHLIENAAVLMESSDRQVFSPKPVHLVKFCRNIVNEVQSYTLQHEIVFSCQSAFDRQDWSIVCVDETLLTPILVNLLSNAIKYSPNANQVTVQLIREPDTIIFRIRDRGMGIPLEEQPHIFDWLYRADNAQTIEGAGLGLAIVKRCVVLHQGTIELESEVDRGTQVTVRLPVTAGVQC